MVIYTKRGDGGETSLYDKESRQNIRISKESLRIRVIGAIDEANSFLGVCASLSEDKKLNNLIIKIQENLFRIGAVLAGAKLRFSTSKTLVLEKEIDKLEGTLPVLKNFILPGGSPLAAHLQVARTIIRRAERELASLNQVESIKPEILSFINRLSDLLFMLARKINFEAKIREKVWKK